MPITELESKRQFKCTWVDSRLKVCILKQLVNVGG